MPDDYLSLEEAFGAVDQERSSAPARAKGELSGYLSLEEVFEPEEQGTLGQLGMSARSGLETSKQALAAIAASQGAMPLETAAEYMTKPTFVPEGYERPEDVVNFEKQLDTGDYWGAAKTALFNPIDVIGTYSAEGLGTSVLPLATGAAGAGLGALTPVPGGAIAGGAVGLGTGSGIVEAGATIMETMAESGVNMKDQKAVVGAFQNPELMATAKDKALKKGLTVAAFDGATAGLAGKFVKGATGVLSHIGRGSAELGVQMAGGGAGEYFGSKAAGEDPKTSAVVAEMLGEAGGGAVEIAGGAALRGRHTGGPPPGGGAREEEPPQEPPSKLPRTQGALATAAQQVTSQPQPTEAIAAADQVTAQGDNVPPVVAPDTSAVSGSAPASLHPAPTPEEIEAQRAEVHPDPTPGQAEADNYKQGHVKVGGLNLTIETPRGGVRKDKANDPPRWEVPNFPADYGKILGTTGMDGEHVDFYLGDKPESPHVVVIDQIDPATGKPDEHKVMLGYDDFNTAMQTYDAAFTDQSGPDRRGAVQVMTLDEFKTWLKEGDTTKPIKYVPVEGLGGKRAETAEPEIAAPEAGYEKHVATVQDMVKKLRQETTGGQMLTVKAIQDRIPDITHEQAQRVLGHLKSKGELTRGGRIPKVSDKPRTVIDIIRDMGGIKPSGEVRARDLNKVSPGTVSNSGKSVGEIREALEEIGMLPPFSSDDAVFGLIDNTLNPNARTEYHPDDYDLVDAQNAKQEAEATQDVLPDAIAEVRAAAQKYNVPLTDEEVEAIAKDIAGSSVEPIDAISDYVERQAIADADEIGVDLDTDEEVPFDGLDTGENAQERDDLGEGSSGAEGVAEAAPESEPEDQATASPGEGEVEPFPVITEDEARDHALAMLRKHGDVETSGFFHEDSGRPIHYSIGSNPHAQTAKGKIFVWDGRTLPRDAHSFSVAQLRKDLAPATEATPEGEQTLIDGVKPVTDKDRLEVEADKPLKPKRPQKDADEGLFDNGARDQQDMFAEPAKKPKGGQRKLGYNGKGNPVFEDENGVRSYLERGIRVTESVGVIPGGGISIDTSSRSNDFKTTEELGEKPAKRPGLKDDAAGLGLEIAGGKSEVSAPAPASSPAKDLEARVRAVIEKLRSIKGENRQRARREAASLEKGLAGVGSLTATERDVVEVERLAERLAGEGPGPLEVKPEDQARIEEAEEKARLQREGKADPVEPDFYASYVNSVVGDEDGGTAKDGLALIDQDIRDKVDRLATQTAELAGLYGIARLQEANAANAPTMVMQAKSSLSGTGGSLSRLAKMAYRIDRGHANAPSQDKFDADLADFTDELENHLARVKGWIAGRRHALGKKAPEAAPSDEPALKLARMLMVPVSSMQLSTDKLTPKKLFDLASVAYGGTAAEGAFEPKDAYDALELAINMVIRETPHWNPALDGQPVRDQIKLMDDMMDRMPNQSRRSGETEAFQQFSTPPHYSHAVAWLANIGKGDVVLEPSAGTGNLAVHALNAEPAAVYANELSDKRVRYLRALGVTKVFNEDAAHLHAILPKEIKPTVIVMNPPFSQTAGRMDKKDLMVGANHIEQALNRLEDGGRLVAVVGRGMAFGAGRFRPWWKKIREKYDVRANVEVDGKVYRRNGTTFATRVLVIDKNPPSGKAPVLGQAETVLDLIESLETVRNERHSREQAPAEQAGGVNAEGTGSNAGAGISAPASTGEVGAGTRPGRKPTDVADASAADRPGGQSDGTRSEEGDGRPGGAARPQRPGPSSDRPGTKGGRSDGPSDVEGSGGGVGATSGPAQPERIALESVTEASLGEIGESVYETYRPSRVRVSGAKPHPTELVESAAMASVMPPVPDYQPALPKKLISEGVLSDAQLESIIYAGQAHQEHLPDGPRRGYFIGDGTGVGKGREISGIVMDNWQQGRKRHVWVSKNSKLLEDAQRDWEALGGKKSDVFDLSKTKLGNDITNSQGILFVTFDTLKTGAEGRRKDKPGVKGSRLDQIAKWAGDDFDGVIAFDEAHLMGNAIAIKGKRGTKKASQRALAGIDLQQDLADARVIYASATGATDVANLSYAERLGLWGTGTPFASKETFISEISSGGVASMELVARDLKALGLYIARGLSFNGVEQVRLTHPLTPEQSTNYDTLAKGWQVVLKNVTEAMAEAGSEKNGQARSSAMSKFWGAHQRFFNSVLTAMQMPSVLNQMEKDLADGNSLVMQIVNTNEAAQERAAAEMSGDEDITDLDMSPMTVLMQYVERGFPTAQYEEYTDENGNIKSRPVLASDGTPVENPAAVEMKDRLMTELALMRAPNPPLEQLIDRFGAEKVSEVTGRQRRFVRQADGTLKSERRGQKANKKDIQAFQDGKKRILIFSEAGGTGASYHADRGAKNKQRRIHYLLQAGWRADSAVQGFGRSHRSNQVTPPLYRLVETDLKGHKRFISTIARRLDQLGALTKGDRQSGGQGMFTEADNLESEHARDAIESLFLDIYRKNVEGITAGDIADQMGIDFIEKETGAVNQSKIPSVGQFLNRLLSLEIEMQDRVFDEFFTRFTNILDTARERGELDVGTETIKADSIKKVSEKVAYTDPRSKAETKVVRLKEIHTVNYLPFDAVKAGAVGFTVNKASGRVWAKGKSYSQTTKTGNLVEHTRLRSPSPFSAQAVPASTLRLANRWEDVSEAKARELWDAEIAKAPKTREKETTLITGAIMPVWDRLKGNPKIVRLATDEGERFLGRVVPEASVPEVMRNLGLEADRPKLTPKQAGEKVLEENYRLKLANGWTMRRSLVGQERRIELEAQVSYQEMKQLEGEGLLSERISYRQRFFVPTGAEMADVMKRLTEYRPIVEAIPPAGAADDEVYSLEDDAPVFFSALTEAVREAKQPKAPAAQWKGIIAKLPGIKAEEVEWSGVNEWLDSQTGSVTREDLAAFLAENEVKVEEVQKAELKDVEPVWSKDRTDDGDRRWTDQFDQMTIVQIDGRYYLEDRSDLNFQMDFEMLGEAKAEARNRANAQAGAEVDGAPKFGRWTLPGGENYRELLLTLPTSTEFDPSKVTFERKRQSVTQASVKVFYDGKELGVFDDPVVLNSETGEYDTKTDEEIIDIARRRYAGSREMGIKPLDEGQTYRSGHWEEPNILAHIRFNERTDADGDRVLLIEEIQSDWHQAGRKRGYDKPGYFVVNKRSGNTSPIFATKAEAQSYADQLPARIQEQVEIKSDLGGKTIYEVVFADDVPLGQYDTREEAQTALDAAFQEDATVKIVERRIRTGIPDAPFKSNWHELAMKRAIRWGAENGFDKIAWTPGDIQAERYDLSKHLSRLEWKARRLKATVGTLVGYDSNGNVVIEQQTSPDEIENYVGKEIAERLLNAEVNHETVRGRKVRRLDGLDLKVGGEGMKGFYDKILPRFAAKYGKKWGAKVGTTKINASPELSLEVRQDPDRPGQFKVVGTEGAEEYTWKNGYPNREMAEAEIRRAKKMNFSSAEVWSLPITGDMRQAVLGGQPLFSLPKPNAAEPAVRASEKQINALIKRIAPQAQAIEAFEGTRRAPNGKRIAGGYQVMRDLIQVALSGKNPTRAARHETIHHLRNMGLFTDAEWSALKDMARKVWMKQYDIEGRYGAIYRERMGAEAEEALIEEAIADAFSDWQSGTLRPRNVIIRAFVKIKRLLDGIARILKNQGYHSYESVFGDVEAGAVGSREMAPDLQSAFATKDPAQIAAALASVKMGVNPPSKSELVAAMTAAGLKRLAALYQGTPDTARAALREAVGEPAETRYSIAATGGSVPTVPAGTQSTDWAERIQGTAAQEAAMRETMQVHDAVPLKDRVRALVDQVKNADWVALKQKTVDQFASWESYEKAVRGKVGDAAMSAYKMARMTQNLQSSMSAVIHHGPLEYTNGGFKVVKGFEGGFQGIFRPLADKGLLHLWKGWAAAERANRLMQEGRENNFTQEQIDALLPLGEKYPEFREVMAKWQAFNKAMLDMAESAGLLNADQRELWENDDYVPFYRVMEEGVTGPHGKKGLAGQRSGVRKLIGGKEKIGDLVENMVLNLTHLVDASFKNVATQRLIEMLDEGGMTDGDVLSREGLDWKVAHVNSDDAAKKLTELGVNMDKLAPDQKNQWLKLFTMVPPKDPAVISVMVDGDIRYYRVHDPLLLSSLATLRPEGQDMLMNALRIPKRALTVSITSFPGFMMRNFIRDTLHSWVVTGEDYTPFIGSAKGFMKSLREDTSLVSIMAAGGGSGGYYRTEATDVRKQLDRRLTGLDKHSVLSSPAKALEVWRKIGLASENANRIALHDAIIAKGGSEAEAAFQAMNLLDFSMHGDARAVRFLIETIPFLNARLQGLHRLYQGAKENPKTFMLRGGVIMAASLALVAANWGDDRYDDLEEWDKDTYYHVFLDNLFPKAALEAAGIDASGWHLRIPKPFEVGAIFSTVPERILRGSTGKDEVSVAGKRLLAIFHDTFAVDMPQFMRPIVEQVANKSFFTDRPIVSQRLQRLQAEAQYTSYTSGTARELGQLTGLSPVRIDEFVRGYGGTLGAYLMQMTGAIINSSQDRPVRPEWRADQIPEIGSFIRNHPSGTTKYITRFYELRSEAQALYSTYREYRRQNRPEDAAALIEEYAPKIRAHKILDKASRKLAGLNRQMRMIEDSTTMSATEKRSQLEAVRATRNDIAKRVVRLVTDATR